MGVAVHNPVGSRRMAQVELSSLSADRIESRPNRFCKQPVVHARSTRNLCQTFINNITVPIMLSLIVFTLFAMFTISIAYCSQLFVDPVIQLVPDIRVSE